MEPIYNLNENILSKITLGTPDSRQGGSYFSKIFLDGEPLIIQTPKCTTKNGIHKTGKKMYSDLMFIIDDKSNEFINGIEKLEKVLQQLIYNNRSIWFYNEPDLDEIEYNWNPVLRTYKSKNMLLRTVVKKNKTLNNISLQIYDENQEEKTNDDIKNDSKIISILQILGIKFTSQSFILEIALKQVMILNDGPLFNKCLIKTPKQHSSQQNNSQQPGLENINESKGVKEDVKKSIDEIVTELVAKPVTEPIKSHEETVKKSVKENEETTVEETVEEKKTEEKTEEKKEKVSTDIKNNNIDEINIEEKSIVTQNSLKLNNKSENFNTDLGENEKIQSINLGKVTKETKNKVIGNIEMQENSISKLITKEINEKTLVNSVELDEIKLELPELKETIKLKTPNEVYLEIYKAARKKAKLAKQKALQAYLEAKKIKQLYMLDEIDSSDEEDELNDLSDDSEILDI